MWVIAEYLFWDFILTIWLWPLWHFGTVLPISVWSPGSLPDKGEGGWGGRGRDGGGGGRWNIPRLSSRVLLGSLEGHEVPGLGGSPLASLFHLEALKRSQWTENFVPGSRGLLFFGGGVTKLSKPHPSLIFFLSFFFYAGGGEGGATQPVRGVLVSSSSGCINFHIILTLPSLIQCTKF